MGAASFLALVARHSLLPVRHSSSVPPQAHNIPFIHDLAAQQPSDALHLLTTFHLDLAERLQQLQLHGTGDAHLNWLLDALASTLSTHSSLQLTLKAATASTNAASAATALAKHRADEVFCMLDVCTALKQVADDMDRQFGCLQDALQSVGHALNSEKPLSSGKVRAAARRLSAYLMKDRPPMTNITSGKQYRPLAEAHASLLLAAKRELHSAPTTDPAATLLSQAIDGAMLTSLLVLASAVSSCLAPPSPRKSSGTLTGACKMIIKFLRAKSVTVAWAAPLGQLHRDLRQEEMSVAGGALFQEVQGLHSAATELHATITNPSVHGAELAVVKQRVESMRKSLQEAQACISIFRKQIASIFQALVTLRLTLLDSSAV